MLEQTYKRIDFGMEQLDVALELFLSRRSLASALTLAGAAEEILGKTLVFQGKETVLDSDYRAIAPVQRLLRQDSYKRKVFIDEKNRVRNAVKHMGNASDGSVVADLEDETVLDDCSRAR